MDTKVLNWDQPLEAVHVDGRVVPAALRSHGMFKDGPNPDCDGDWWAIIGDMAYCCSPDGQHCAPGNHGWTIRNVAPKEVEWGPEIKVEGKRPEWLREDAFWQWRIKNDPQFEDGIEPSKYVDARTFGLIDVIRLPANHPHYATPTRTALEQRMEDLVRRMAQSAGAEGAYTLFDCIGEARAILAELEPVDPDLIEAREIEAVASEKNGFADYAKALRNGEYDEDGPVRCTLNGIRRGRALGRGE